MGMDQTAEHTWKAGTLVPLPAVEHIPYKPGNNRSRFSCISTASMERHLPAGFVSSLLGFPSIHVISSFSPVCAGAYVCVEARWQPQLVFFTCVPPISFLFLRLNLIEIKRSHRLLLYS